MCGIVGYVGDKQVQRLVLEALKRLEYRGYDSAGIAVIDDANGKMNLYKDKGEIARLERGMPELRGRIGIAHTRWATHGQPIKNNAHPFYDCKEKMALIHNGILENYMELKEELLKKGHVFRSETDTEVFAHLIEENFNGDIEEAVRNALKTAQGSYAIVVLHSDQPDRIVAARNESPLILGLGSGENFVASDVPALLSHTNKIIYLDDGEMAVVKKDSVKITDIEGDGSKEKQKEVHTIKWSVEDAEKGGYEHFMLKEIFEQPSAIHASTLGRILDFDGSSTGYAYAVDSIKIIACGTSYHAGLIGKYIIENLIRIPVTVEMASEYRYSSPAYENPLVLLISQSGETADTLAAAREAKQRGCRTIAITNVVGSTLTREVDDIIYTRAGPEIGVAATKTFITQLVALYILAMRLGVARKILKFDEIEDLKRQLRTLPRYVQKVLDNAGFIKEMAKEISKAKNMFFIGRNINYPSALEGALKLKEISYIHAEGYPAGELKHGPLALLTSETPVVAIAVKDHTYKKMLGNIGEVSARESPVYAVGFRSDEDLSKYVDRVIYVPEVSSLFSPVPVIVALQLLSYYAAKELGCSIDKPRNLAKSVTVE